MECDSFSSIKTDVDRAIRNLFPLPLVPFELLMLLDDCPQFPMSFCVEMVVRGQPQRDRLQRAVTEAVARHPLLRAHVRWTRGRPEWVLSDRVGAPIHWLDEGARQAGDVFQPIDLTRDCGLRILAAAGGSHSNIWLHFHHACCDGQGARRFAADLWTGYARACLGDLAGPAWDELDYDSLRRRAVYAARSPAEGPAATTTWQKIRDAFHFHVLTPKPLARSQLVSVSAATNPGVPIRKHSFDREQTQRFAQAARRQRLNVNDVALALLFLTLADWNRQHGRAPDRQRLRVLMPTDLRTATDARMPAINRMSFAFLARTIGQCRDFHPLVTGIQAETRYYHQVQIGRDFLDGIALIGRIPSLLQAMLQLPRCMATAILTNLGDPTRRFRRRFPVEDGCPRIGDVALERIYGTPPLRAQMHAGFGLCECSRQLSLTMTGNDRVLGNDADTLFQSYIDRWHDWSN